MDASKLKSVFRDAALEAGYVKVEVCVEEFDLLKVRWVRSEDWIRFFVPDYLLALTPRAASSLAKHILAQISGEARAPYPAEVMSELTSEEFALANQPVFLERIGKMEVQTGTSIPAWDEYRRMAEEQCIRIPGSICIVVAPSRYGGETVFPMMRVALMPKSVLRGSKKARLAWIEDAVVKIGKGPGVPGAPDHYVEVE